MFQRIIGKNQLPTPTQVDMRTHEGLEAGKVKAHTSTSRKGRKYPVREFSRKDPAKQLKEALHRNGIKYAGMGTGGWGAYKGLREGGAKLRKMGYKSEAIIKTHLKLTKSLGRTPGTMELVRGVTGKTKRAYKPTTDAQRARSQERRRRRLMIGRTTHELLGF